MDMHHPCFAAAWCASTSKLNVQVECLVIVAWVLCACSVGIGVEWVQVWAGHGIRFHGMAWDGMGWHGMRWHGVAWHGVASHHMYCIAC